MRPQQLQRRFWVATAAVAALQSPAMAFAPPQPNHTVPPQPAQQLLDSSSRSSAALTTTTSTTLSPQQSQPYHQTLRSYSTSLYSMLPNDNQDGGGGILGGLKKAAKSILPKKWFQSEEERRQEEEKKRLKQEITGGLSQVLKDAPLPIRMVGNLVAPLMGNALSSLAQAAQEQQATVDQIRQQATFALQNDVAVQQAMGTSSDLQVLSPVSQSSSTSNINGQVTTRIQLQVPVVGSLGQGMASLSATENGLQSIVLQTPTGRRINVPVSVGASSTYGRQGRIGGNRNNDSDIIEAEIIDEKKNGQ